MRKISYNRLFFGFFFFTVIAAVTLLWTLYTLYRLEVWKEGYEYLRRFSFFADLHNLIDNQVSILIKKNALGAKLFLIAIMVLLDYALVIHWIKKIPFLGGFIKTLTNFIPIVAAVVLTVACLMIWVF